MSDVAEVEAKESHAENIHTPLPGQKLKKARENRNLEQIDIAKELKLDLRFVKALEEERFNELPQPVYTAGYVRAYSKLVGLVPDEIVSEYSSHQKAATVTTKTEEAEKEDIPSHYRHVQNSLPKSFSVGHAKSDDKRKFNLAIAVLVIVVVIAIAWQASNNPSEMLAPVTTTDEADVNAPDSGQAPPASTTDIESDAQSKVKLSLPKLESQDSAVQLVESAEQSSDAEQINEELVQNAQQITELSLHFSEDSWVDIRDATGKPIIRKLGVAGKTNTVSGVPPFEVLLGYSPGVSIERDGEPYDLSAYSEKRVARFVLKGDGGVESSRSTINIPGSKIERSEPFSVLE